MSDSANPGDDLSASNSSPRALIHKKILETAASMPEATMAEVAESVSGASTDLVERVLEEYGDPAADEPGPDGTLTTDGDGPATEAAAHSDGQGLADDTQPDGSAAPDGDLVPDGSAHPAGESAPPADADPAAGESAPGAVEPPPAPADTDDREAATASDETPVRGPGDLTEKERAMLEVVAERPDATQREVADVLGVSRATVSKRASGIEGFDWGDRASFVDRLFGPAGEREPAASGSGVSRPSAAPASAARGDGDPTSATAGRGCPSAAGPAAYEDVAARLDRIEARLDALAAGETAGSPGGITDPELAHKVVHACMESEHVSETEELDVVAAVIRGDAPG